MKIVDRIIRIPNAEAMHWSRSSPKEGIFSRHLRAQLFGGTRSLWKKPQGVDDSVHVAGYRRALPSTALFADIPST